MKKNLYYKIGDLGNVDFADRWNDLNEMLDLDRDDTVLDIGCAEGLISIEVSKKVKKVTGFDVEPFRIKNAENNAKEQNIRNVEFLVSNYKNFRYKEYDKILCLGVYHKIKDGSRRAMLETMFNSCRKQFYIRVPIIDNKTVFENVGVREEEIMEIANNNRFELLHRTQPRHNHGTIFKFQKH